ncbi:g1856 [Coccomyxa viridis]|uniref:G1856 protein n=1 Tax=Coccomyxa viridis TaxID=1274662 RepID=A0ABP1FIY5_9CHLO
MAAGSAAGKEPRCSWRPFLAPGSLLSQMKAKARGKARETLVTPRKLLVRLFGPERFLFLACWASVSVSWSDITWPSCQ